MKEELEKFKREREVSSSKENSRSIKPKLDLKETVNHEEYSEKKEHFFIPIENRFREIKITDEKVEKQNSNDEDSSSDEDTNSKKITD